MELEIDKPENYQTRDGFEILGIFRKHNGGSDLIYVYRGEGGVARALDAYSDGCVWGNGDCPKDIIPKEKRLYKALFTDNGEPELGDGIYAYQPIELSAKYITWIEGKPETVELIK